MYYKRPQPDVKQLSYIVRKAGVNVYAPYIDRSEVQRIARIVTEVCESNMGNLWGKRVNPNEQYHYNHNEAPSTYEFSKMRDGALYDMEHGRMSHNAQA